MLVSQFAKDEVEAAGLVKFDFLGLKTLTVIDDAIRLVRQNHPEQIGALRRATSPSTTRRSTSSSRAGDTAGVFQMESERLHRAW